MCSKPFIYCGWHPKVLLGAHLGDDRFFVFPFPLQLLKGSPSYHPELVFTLTGKRE